MISRYEEFIENIIRCHQKALDDPNHPCHGIVRADFLCEPFRLRDFPPKVQADVMFLGLSPGNPEQTTPPFSPPANAEFEYVREYCKKPIADGYHTNFRNAMKERIGRELEYVKANLVHGIGNKETALKCLKPCGDKFLLDMIGLFSGLKYVIVYDFKDRKVLDYVNIRLGINLDFKDSTVTKSSTIKNGMIFMAAPRTRRYIRRMSEAELAR